MLAVAEIPMIERVLSHLAMHGVDEAVLSLGYRPECFVRAFPEGVACDVKLSYAVDPEPLDTAGAIRFSALAAGVSETFLVVNGDVLTDADYSALLAWHAGTGAEATIALTPVEDPSAYGVVLADPTGRVTAFIEKPPRDETPTNLINAGAYVLEPRVLDKIPAGRPVSVERQTFPALVAEGCLFAWDSEAYWIDAGTPESYLRACVELIDGTRPGPPVPGARRVSPDVWAVGAPVVMGELRGPSLVADGALVAAGAMVEGSALGRGARVLEGAVVRGSVLLAGAAVGAGSLVEGSILGEGASVGEWARIRGLSVLGGRAVVAAGVELEGARLPCSGTEAVRSNPTATSGPTAPDPGASVPSGPGTPGISAPGTPAPGAPMVGS